MNEQAETVEQESSEPTTRRRGRPPKAETVNFRIKSMGGKYITGGVNVIAGIKGKIKPGDVCAVSEEVADTLTGCDMIEMTREPANCRIEGNEIVRD